MSFAIQLDQDQELINTKLIGEFTPELLLEFFQDLLLKVKHTGIRRVFTDATEVRLALSIEEFSHLPVQLLKIGFPTDLKRAILVEGDTEVFKQWESLLFSKGFQRVKLFHDEDIAREWLMA
ncbi:MAG: hypothetical protein Roseis2KO_16350 [Roseivirga sp.]